MKNSLKQSLVAKKGVVAASALLLCPCCITSAEVKPAGNAPVQKEQKMTESAGGFYCNTKALSPSERTRHEALTKKLLAIRKAAVETDKGYELQFRPADVTVAEVAEWVVMESKCCSFFDFHIDLENAGTLICLRLTGADGVKQFIRAEFGLS